MLNSGTFRALALAFGCLISFPVLAQGFLFSTAQPGAVDGEGGPGTTQFSDGDIVFFNPSTGIGSIYLLDDVINDGGLPDTNALFVQSNGIVIFSTQSASADFPFQDDKLVMYDPVADTLSLFYDFAGIMTSTGDVDIDGFHLLSNGNYLITNTGDFTLDSQNFLNGDIVEFDPVSQTASLFFSESLFEGTDNIWVRSISLLPNGNLLLSAFNQDTGGAITLGGLTFGRGDLVEYDLANDTGSLFASAAIFGGATEDIDAVHVFVPLPAAAWLLASALGLLGWFRSKRVAPS